MTRSFSAPTGAQAGKLDFTSPESLLASIQALIPQHMKQGADLVMSPARLTHGIPLLTGLEVHAVPAHQLVSETHRAETMSAMAAAFVQRATHKHTNRLLNPLAALQSAPGGGKSTVLDIAAVLSSRQAWSAQLCGDEVVRGILNASTPVLVTYTSGTPVDVETHDASVRRGLALRILYSFFVRSEQQLRFTTFCRRFVGEDVDLRTVIEACQLAAARVCSSRTSILLLVDETAKVWLRDENRGNELVSCLGSMLDTFTSEEVNIVVSTLDAVYVNDAVATTSGRRIAWLPMADISFHDAVHMFTLALERDHCSWLTATGQSHEAGKVSPLPVIVRAAISDCAGHPRSLEYLLSAVRSRVAASRNGAEPWFTAAGALDDLRQHVMNCMREAPPVWAVHAALSNKRYKLRDVIDGSNCVTMHAAIASGALLNTSATRISDSIVPKLSMIALLHGCEGVSSFKSQFPHYIRDMASEETTGVVAAPPTLDAGRFERFVAYWLQARISVAHENGMAQPDELNLSQMFDIPPPRDRDHFLLWQLVHSADDVSIPLIPIPTTFRNTAASVLNVVPAVYTFPGTGRAANEAFDILFLTNAVRYGRKSPFKIAVAVETRFSAPDVECLDGRLEVTRNVSSLWERLHPQFEKIGVEAQHLVYVYMANVKLASSVHDEVAARTLLLQQRVILLDRAGVRNALSASISDRALFLDSLTDTERSISHRQRLDAQRNASNV